MDDEPLQDNGKVASRKPRISMHKLANPDGGLVCRKCGCRDFRVYYTRQRKTCVFRVKICRHCGFKISTTERETGCQQ